MKQTDTFLRDVPNTLLVNTPYFVKLLIDLCVGVTPFPSLLKEDLVRNILIQTVSTSLCNETLIDLLSILESMNIVDVHNDDLKEMV